MTMITIGVLAHNEEKRIVRTLESLLQQTLFAAPRIENRRIEIVVVPNGCRDKTADLAEATLDGALTQIGNPLITARIAPLAQPGKSNAWNELVHSIADPGTDVFVMIDADIEFGDPETIENAVDCLLDHPTAQVVVDLPLNDLTRKDNPKIIERLLARTSWMKFDAPPSIAGSFYCASGAMLRDIWMPVGLSGEDGFLFSMVLTDCFRKPPDHARVVRAVNASHYYEGLSNIRSIIRHEVRLAIGTVLNIYLCWYVLVFLTDPDGPGAGDLIQRLNKENDGWYARLLETQIASRGFWVLPNGMFLGTLTRRFRWWRDRNLGAMIVELPLRCAALGVDLVVLWIANRKLRKNFTVGYW